MKLLVVIAATLLLSGCASMALKSRVELAAMDESTCLNYGFKKGTDYFARCMMEVDMVRQQDNRERRAQFSRAMLQMSTQMAANRPTTCNTYGSAMRSGTTTFGNATTTCY